MAYSGFDTPTKQIFWGNIFLIACCAFYLAWWLLAFRPAGAAPGRKVGFLLIPAFAAGLLAVILTIRGIGTSARGTELFSGAWILWGGLAAYLVLLAVTLLLLKRPVTTELFLIVGWAVLALSEINALYGMGRFSHPMALVFVACVIAAAAISLVCYVLYYNLSGRAGYVDGMVPLLAIAVMTAILSIRMAAI